MNMRSASPSLLLSLVLLSPLLADADIHFHDKDEGLFSFVSRPELRAPRWKVNITEPKLVSPGYWFVAPFEFIDQHEPGNGWIGPHIYDGNGELVWSGVSMTQNWDAIDFKMSNVRGEDRITFLVQREGEGYILGEDLEIREKVDVGTLGVDFNSHEFYFIENGTRALVMDEGRRDATKEQALAIDYDQNCRALFNGFKVLDTKSWKPLFEWSSFGHIGLNESTFLDGGVDRLCRDEWGWDFNHLNSVDKDHNGDYYVSARHTDTIYKVSQKDGHIMWRLNGHQGAVGDFGDMEGLKFSRQHNVRFRGYDGTHEYISILDNANGQDDQKPTHDLSRGLVIALRTDVEPKTARIVKSIDHPYGKGAYAPRRGNYQILPNEHIFMGWSEQATHSEHSKDGKLLMEASMIPEWLGSYRSYKFPFVGRPAQPPVASSTVFASKARNSSTTMVHVSWNGATEVDRWNLYKTTETGEPMIQIFQKKKEGFETALAWDGYAAFVVVEGIDRKGKVLGSTDIVKTGDLPADAVSVSVAEEIYWLQEMNGENDDWKSTNPYLPQENNSSSSRTLGGSFILFLFGVLCSAGVLILLWRLKARGVFRAVKFARYQSLPANDSEQALDGLADERYPKREPGDFRDRQ